jgi:hypothetical protein
LTFTIQNLWGRFAQTSLLALLVALSRLPASAQIMSEIESHGRKIWCAQSGLFGFSMPCGADNYHEFVLVGTVLAIASTGKDESRLTIKPEEVFWGKPPATLSVLTNERDCMPDLHVGDKWLFNLYRRSGSKELILEYGHGSLPVADAGETLARLRRLEDMPDAGLIQGSVAIDRWGQHAEGGPTLANRKVIARRELDHKEYAAVTDEDGRYEFEPLPLGTYDVSGNTDPRFWADDGTVDIKPHSCSAVDFNFAVDGQISGKLMDSFGSPLADVEVQAFFLEQDINPGDTRTDAQGLFTLHGLPAGDYVLKMTLHSIPYDQTKTKEIYYPGASDKTQAQVFHLQLGQRIQLPNPPESERTTCPIAPLAH